jgi:hypothetical protein
MQDVAEKQVVLVAVPAASVPHEFLLERRRIEANRPSQKRIEVLEGNRLWVVKMNGGEGVDAHRPRPCVANALTVGVDVNS